MNASKIPGVDSAAVNATIAARLKQIRQDSGRSLRDIERLTGLTNAQICMIENGQSTARAEVLYRFAVAFGVTPDWFYGDLLDPARLATTRAQMTEDKP